MRRQAGSYGLIKCQAATNPPRGVSYWAGMKSEIVFGTRAGLLIALHAGTGAPVKSFGKDGVVDLHSDAVMQGFP
jgi:glucose dehydrogenase